MAHVGFVSRRVWTYSFHDFMLKSRKDGKLYESGGCFMILMALFEFNVKQLDLTHRKEGFIELRSANPKYPTFRIDEYDDFRVWGVVIWTIKKWK